MKYITLMTLLCVYNYIYSKSLKRSYNISKLCSYVRIYRMKYANTFYIY